MSAIGQNSASSLARLPVDIFGHLALFMSSRCLRRLQIALGPHQSSNLARGVTRLRFKILGGEIFPFWAYTFPNLHQLEIIGSTCFIETLSVGGRFALPSEPHLKLNKLMFNFSPASSALLGAGAPSPIIRLLPNLTHLEIDSTEPPSALWLENLPPKLITLRFLAQRNQTYRYKQTPLKPSNFAKLPQGLEVLHIAFGSILDADVEEFHFPPSLLELKLGAIACLSLIRILPRTLTFFSAKTAPYLASSSRCLYSSWLPPNLQKLVLNDIALHIALDQPLTPSLTSIKTRSEVLFVDGEGQEFKNEISPEFATNLIGPKCFMSSDHMAHHNPVNDLFFKKVTHWKFVGRMPPNFNHLVSFISRENMDIDFWKQLSNLNLEELISYSVPPEAWTVISTLQHLKSFTCTSARKPAPEETIRSLQKTLSTLKTSHQVFSDFTVFHGFTQLSSLELSFITSLTQIKKDPQFIALLPLSLEELMLSFIVTDEYLPRNEWWTSLSKLTKLRTFSLSSSLWPFYTYNTVFKSVPQSLKILKLSDSSIPSAYMIEQSGGNTVVDFTLLPRSLKIFYLDSVSIVYSNINWKGIPDPLAVLTFRARGDFQLSPAIRSLLPPNISEMMIATPQKPTASIARDHEALVKLSAQYAGSNCDLDSC